MNYFYIFILLSSVIFSYGCETVHDTTKKAGTVVGKGADAFGGFTEGAAEAVKGQESSEENPYNR